MAQPIYVDIYGLGAYFPFAFAGVSILMAASSFVNSQLVERFGQRRLSHGALLAFILLSALLALISMGGNPPFWIFIVLFACTMPMFGLIGSNINSLAMEPLGSIAGTASSVIGFMQTVGGGLLGAAFSYFYAGEIFTLAAGNLILSSIAMGAVLIAENGRLFAKSPSVS